MSTRAHRKRRPRREWRERHRAVMQIAAAVVAQNATLGGALFLRWFAAQPRARFRFEATGTPRFSYRFIRRGLLYFSSKEPDHA